MLSISSVSSEDNRVGISDIASKAKVRYFDGSGEDVTPVPLFVPPEPSEDEKVEGDDVLVKKAKPRVMQTFLKVINFK